MDKIKKINITDILLSIVFSIFLTMKAYGLLYKKCTYSDLNDFFVGISIYTDHNKYLDTSIYFLYLILFFAFLPLFSLLRNKFIKSKNKVINEQKKNENKLKRPIKKIKEFFIKYQYIGAFGYIFLHPLNGDFYPIIFTITCFLILLSLYDVFRLNRKENNEEFSIFITTAILFAIFFNSYNVNLAPTDDHHFGEKFATFFLHNNFNLKYYKDIMLVHGYFDVIPSWIGCYFFKQNNVFGYCLGDIFYRNISFILAILSGLIIFKNNRLFIAPLLFFKGTNLAVLFINTYLLLIKEEIRNKPYIWLCLYTLSGFLFCMLWTTIGTFWVIASLPVIIYQLYKITTNKEKNKYIKSILAITPVLFLIINMRSVIVEYFKEASEYIKGNLLAFGNNFDNFIFCLPQIIHYGYKLFAYIILPIFIIEFIKEINKDKKDTKSILFLIFTIIFPIIALSYTFGRLDGDLLQRVEYVSIPYILIIFPYFLYKFSNKNYNYFLIMVIITAFIMSASSFTDKFSQYKKYDSNTHLFNVGQIKLEENNEKRINEIKNFVYENSTQNSTYLDLTNRGMHYLYINKKIPIKFVSFYNAISTKQANQITTKLQNNLPNIILIDSNTIMHDNIHLSLRLNSLYRKLILSGNYRLLKNNNNIFLIKTKENNKYTEQELETLDYIFGYRNLNYLPEVWGNSVNTLPLTEVLVNYNAYKNNELLTINFPNYIKGTEFDFIYIEPLDKSKKHANYYIEINNTNSELFCKVKRNGKILIPFDSYPSWLLNEKIQDIKIYSNKIFDGDYIIKFYKRKYK